jgi:D-arabinose 1-dehydrogenase-like Zn-dependent alcohol dehydrogenase
MVCEVSQVGSEVKDFKKGDLVGFGTQRDCCDKCKWCQRGEEEVCPNVQDKGTYGKYWGGYSTAVQQPAKFFFHLSFQPWVQTKFVPMFYMPVFAIMIA